MDRSAPATPQPACLTLAFASSMPCLWSSGSAGVRVCMAHPGCASVELGPGAAPDRDRRRQHRGSECSRPAVPTAWPAAGRCRRTSVRGHPHGEFLFGACANGAGVFSRACSRAQLTRIKQNRVSWCAATSKSCRNVAGDRHDRAADPVLSRQARNRAAFADDRAASPGFEELHAGQLG